MSVIYLNNGGTIIAGALQPGWTCNLGLKIDGTELQLCSADGSDLSTTNKGYACVRSVTAGENVVLEFTATSTAAGTALDENTYPVNAGHGVTTTVAWANNVPFFVYIVNEDDTAANAGFFLSRDPTLSVTPAAGYIHDTDAIGGTADSQNHISGFWADDAGKAAKPCQLIGAVQRQWSTVTDRWTTQALTNKDGIGQDKIDAICSTSFTMSAGQNGGQASHYTTGNGPTWGAYPLAGYTIARNGMCNYYLATDTNRTANGGDAAQLEVVLPYNPSVSSANCGVFKDKYGGVQGDGVVNARTGPYVVLDRGGVRVNENVYAGANDYMAIDITYKAF